MERNWLVGFLYIVIKYKQNNTVFSNGWKSEESFFSNSVWTERVFRVAYIISKTFGIKYFKNKQHLLSVDDWRAQEWYLNNLSHTCCLLHISRLLGVEFMFHCYVISPEGFSMLVITTILLFVHEWKYLQWLTRFSRTENEMKSIAFLYMVSFLLYVFRLPVNII